MFETDEQGQEYDRLTASIDAQASFLFARHSATSAGESVEHGNHLRVVGELARKYAQVVHSQDCFLLACRYILSVCESAGYLHEVMLQGASFEHVVNVADEATAKIVASVTPDMRQPHPKRIRLFANQIGLASAEAQLVKLADIRHTCNMYVKCGRVPEQQLSDFFDMAHEVLPCLHKIANTKLSLRIKAVKADLKVLDRRLKRK